MKVLLFLIALPSMVIGLIKLSLLVSGQVPSSQYFEWLMLYTVGLLLLVISLQRMYSVRSFDPG